VIFTICSGKEIENHWNTPEIPQMWKTTRTAHVSWLGFIGQQALLRASYGHAHLPGGAVYFLWSREGRGYRFIGGTYVFCSFNYDFRGRIYDLETRNPMLFAPAR